MFGDAIFKLNVKMLEEHIRRGDWKAAVSFYHSAVKTRPDNPYLRAFAERINEGSEENLIPLTQTRRLAVHDDVLDVGLVSYVFEHHGLVNELPLGTISVRGGGRRLVPATREAL